MKVLDNCEGQTFQLTVSLYPSELAWDEIACKGRSGCRSHASMLSAAVDMYPYDSLDEVYLAHEFGHLLGLADIYREEGAISYTLDQPPSLMSASIMDSKSVKAITVDDKNGLFKLIDAMLANGGSDTPSCPDGYTLDTDAKGKNYGAVFCAPATPEKMREMSEPLIRFEPAKG